MVAHVDVDTSQADTFEAVMGPALYTRWQGVPVSIDAAGSFACTLEWGPHVRGRYEVVVAPRLIAMQWDFDDDKVPVPVTPSPPTSASSPEAREPTWRCTSWWTSVTRRS